MNILRYAIKDDWVSPQIFFVVKIFLFGSLELLILEVMLNNLDI